MITLILGSRPHVLVLHDAPDELDPELVFKAANRIACGLGSSSQDCTEDQRHLAEPWQRQLRDLLDHSGAPSMSVNDTIYFTSITGQELGGIQCAARGWVKARLPRTQAINGGHLCFAGLIIVMVAAPAVMAGAVAFADWAADRWLTRSRDRRLDRDAYFTDAWSRRNEP